MTWQVRVWCGDCGNGQDPMGCFDGDSELYDDVFDTREEAEVFVTEKERKMGRPWQYGIEESSRPTGGADRG